MGKKDIIINKVTTRSVTEQQTNPLLPGYSFNAHLVTGLTPIEANGYLDFFIDRPSGMKGYILNLTVYGKGIIYNGDQYFICQPGDFLLFPPGEIHHYGRDPDASQWHHQWVYFRPRAYWQEWLSWPTIVGQTGYYRPDENHSVLIKKLFLQVIEEGQKISRYAEILAMNLLEQLLIRREETINDSQNPPLDNRIHDACLFIAENLTDKDFNVGKVADHVFLSISRLSHLFRQQMGMSILAWREEQRINQAKLLLGTTRMSVASIGYNVGFDDQLYFSRVFRKCTGMSPSEFRKVCEENVVSKKV